MSDRHAAATPPPRAVRRVLDVSRLPDHAFGHQGLIWWGTVGFMVIEGSIFVMGVVTYFFLRTRVSDWPPGVPDPSLMFGTLNTIVLLVSVIPNQIAKRAAENLELGKVRRWLPVCLGFGAVFLVVRAFEFGALNVSWNTNAYGSIVWFLMAAHTAHMLTDFGETAVLTALVFTGHVEPKRLVDVNENAIYWDFVVLSWVPIYLIVYFAPRWL